MTSKRMVKYIAATLLSMLFLFGVINAQTKILGKITDENSRPLPFASVILLLKDSMLLSNAITDENGKFFVAYNPQFNQTYTISISLIGFQPFKKHFVYPDTNFIKSIVLVANKNALNNVTVMGSKPLITRKSDRYVINVENSYLANGNSGLEVLQKSPGIWTDNNGSIHIKGNAPVMVMINDVVQRMSEEDLQEYMKTLKSEDISKIEVISNPSSEFEAQGSGGIIHIILKKARKDGINGSVNSQYRQQNNKPYSAGGASLDYKIKNLYLFGNYSINRDIKPIIDASELIFNNSRFYNNYTVRTDDFFRHQYRFGIAYDFANNQTFNLQSSINTNNMTQSFITSITDKTSSLITTGTTTANRQRNVGYNSTTFNYLFKLDTVGSSLKIIGDYSTNNKKETSHFYELYSDANNNSIYRNNAPNSTTVYSIQADYTKSFKNKTELKTGVKYVAIKRDNEIIKEDSLNNNWIKNSTASDHFIYNEKLLMFYSSLEKTIYLTTIKIGLRAEETTSIGNSISTNQQFTKHYFGLFPSFYISQTLNETKGNSIYLNYSRRLTRPTLSDLNPNKLQFSSNTSMIGNPNLLPQYAHNIEVGATLLNKYSGNIYFTKTTNIITLLASSDSNNFINYTSVNLNSSTEYGINLTAPFKLFKNWATINSLEANYLSYTFNNQLVHQATFSIRSVHNFNIKNIVDIDAVANYRSATQYSNIASPGSFYFDMGFTKKIFQKKAIARLYFADIFNGIYEKEITNEPNLYINFYRKRPTRTISLSLTYNFSFGKKFTQKKIEQSGNDVKSRIGN